MNQVLVVSINKHKTDNIQESKREKGKETYVRLTKYSTVLTMPFTLTSL